MIATDVAIKPVGLWLKMAHQIQRLVLDGLHQTSPEVYIKGKEGGGRREKGGGRREEERDKRRKCPSQNKHNASATHKGFPHD